MASIITGRPYEPQIKVLCDTFKDKPRGTIITYAELAQAAGEATESERMKVLRRKWAARMLKDYGVGVRNVRGTGVQLYASAAEQLHCESTENLRRAARSMTKAVASAEFTREEELDEPGKAARSHYLTRVRPIAALVADARKVSTPLLAAVTKKH